MVDTFTPALRAIRNLLEDGLTKLNSWAGTNALAAHAEIDSVVISEKRAAFFRHFLPLRRQMVVLLAESYRRYFRLAVAHASQTGGDPHNWAQTQLQPVISAALEWIRDWYLLACDGESQSVRRLGSVDFVPGQTVSLSIPMTIQPSPPRASWRAPAWLFGISLALLGVGPLKQQHVPNTESLEKLGEAHTRLLLKGARRVFLWELGVVIETVQNEETAAAGAIPAERVSEQSERPDKGKRSKGTLKGTVGLVRRVDLSQYMDNLTEKQRLAFSLKYEYGLGLADIASRMELNRKTAYEHIEAAKRRVDQTRSNEKDKARRAKTTRE